MREPYNTAELRRSAASHFCEVSGSTVYCSSLDCPYCGDDD